MKRQLQDLAERAPVDYPLWLMHRVRTACDPTRPPRDASPLEDDDLELLCADLFNLETLGVLPEFAFWHTPNEGKRSRRGGRRMRRKGLRRGVSDLIVDVEFDLDGRRWKGLVVELKRAWPSLSKLPADEINFLTARRHAGWIAEVCCGAAEALDLFWRCYDARR